MSTDQTSPFDLKRGFLPHKDPISHLSKTLSEWENLALELPKLLTSDFTRQQIESLPPFDLTALKTPEETERAMLILSYLGHAYVWNKSGVVDKIPAVLAKPWVAVAKKLGRPPVLSYASYALYNWERIDKKGPIELGNIALLQNFLGGLDEEWFILVHVDIEGKAGTGINAIKNAHKAINEKKLDVVIENLSLMAKTLQNMCDVLDRMPEHCDPYIYYNRVRPYIHGWKDNPALPNGLLYEGVAEYQNQPQKFKGETGAQSTIIPSFDAALGIEHEDNPLKKHLDEMQNYMPIRHREFLNQVKHSPSLRDYVLEHFAEALQLRDLYNQCLHLIIRFRQTHFRYAAQYIQKQSQTSKANPTSVGTGGTPFMDYLRKHLNETENFLI